MANLSELSLSELKKLRKEVDKAITEFEARRKKEALVQLEAKAAELGYSLSELTGSSKKNSVPKFRNPDNASQTWTGRGRQPEWFKSALAAGKTADQLAI